jgi:hypothetical protein
MSPPCCHPLLAIDASGLSGDISTNDFQMLKR